MKEKAGVMKLPVHNATSLYIPYSKVKLYAYMYMYIHVHDWANASVFFMCTLYVQAVDKMHMIT